MNELILQDCPEFPGLIDLGSCSIHVIHNAFGKGLEKYGKEVDPTLYGSTCQPMTSKKELKSTGTGYSNYSLMKES